MGAQILLMILVDKSATSAGEMTETQLFGVKDVIGEGIVIVASPHGEFQIPVNQI